MFQVSAKSLIELDINNEKKSVAVRPADTLLYAIREQLGLTGTKYACGNGDCDACTVLTSSYSSETNVEYAAVQLWIHPIEITERGQWP